VKDFLYRHRHAFAYIIITVAVIISLKNSNNRLYNNSYQACKRVNILRIEENDRLISINEANGVLEDFIQSAFEARSNVAKATGSEIDQAAANKYKKLLERLGNIPKPQKVTVVDCDTVIAKP